jgi:hypothetical protein
MNIKKHLPRPVERKLIQARIDRGLYDKLRARLKKDDIDIRDFFEAAAKAYLDEK